MTRVQLRKNKYPKLVAKVLEDRGHLVVQNKRINFTLLSTDAPRQQVDLAIAKAEIIVAREIA